MQKVPQEPFFPLQMHATQANGAFPLKTNCVRVYFKLQYNGQQ